MSSSTLFFFVFFFSFPFSNGSYSRQQQYYQIQLTLSAVRPYGVNRWFMPVNIGLIYLLGGTLGWITVKLLRPERHLEGLIIAASTAGT